MSRPENEGDPDVRSVVDAPVEEPSSAAGTSETENRESGAVSQAPETDTGTAAEAVADTDAAPGAEAGENSADAEGAVLDPLDEFPVTWLNQEGEPEQGPLYVLWELIESYRVDIFEVSLHRITEDFLQFLRRAEELRVELASSFAVMASRLIYYKSRALLPDPGFEEADDEARMPPELVQQLLEYRKFQLAAENLRQLDETSAGMLSRKTGLVPHTGSDDSNEWLDVSLVDLIQAYSNLLNRRTDDDEVEEERYEIEMEEFSVADKAEYLRGLLKENQSFSFDELFENIDEMSRGEIIATFLALLEMTKQGEIILRQKANFEEIRVFKKSVLVR